MNPELEALLHSGYAEELYPELEWSSFGTAAKNNASPFFNWIKGASSKPSKVNTKPKTTYATPAANYPKPQTETQLVKNAIANGERNENVLSDGVFFKRHPELGGRPLTASMPNFGALSKEWISIRNSIVRPALQQPFTTPVTTTPPPGYSGGKGKISLQTILNALTRKSYVIYTKPYQLNIVGVRANTLQPNSFDDTINVFYKDNTGNWQFKSNPATTDPGTYYLNNPMNVNGTAIVIPGQYINSHKIGLHRGEYTALVQQGLIKVTRDYNKDNKLDFKTGREENGTFGINIHKAGSSSTQVDRWSAGCQVFANSNDFAAFMQLCQQHKTMHGDNFTYTLIEEGDL
ncbi:MAG: hypothetical protein H7Z13_10825 [Ferruginibacter sp.]|nr:hypothetical protein [Ferruginibacter sp.]